MRACLRGTSIIAIESAGSDHTRERDPCEAETSALTLDGYPSQRRPQLMLAKRRP
jgi:hypothetical protein